MALARSLMVRTGKSEGQEQGLPAPRRVSGVRASWPRWRVRCALELATQVETLHVRSALGPAGSGAFCVPGPGDFPSVRFDHAQKSDRASPDWGMTCVLDSVISYLQIAGWMVKGTPHEAI